MTQQEINRIKCERLADVLRRVIANPHNAEDLGRSLLEMVEKNWGSYPAPLPRLDS